MLGKSLLTPLLPALAAAGTVIWDGRFNDYTTAADLDNWSWSKEVGSYQWYIHGTGPTTDYVNFSPSYKNPANTASKQGAKFTISPTALWNSDMWRTELIPQTSQNLGTGKLWYHFSVSKAGTNGPNPAYEHQLCFFESHFTELKYGSITTGAANNRLLHWFVGGTNQWAVADWTPGVWHNFAYEIDFSAGTVALWHSRGADDLALVHGAVKASASSNSADWHLGVLRLPDGGGANNSAPEDWYFDGVYVESGSINTKIGSGSAGRRGGRRSSDSTPTSTGSTSPRRSTPSASPAGGEEKYRQCGGKGWTGATVCVTGCTCTKVNDYYSECL